MSALMRRHALLAVVAGSGSGSAFNPADKHADITLSNGERTMTCTANGWKMCRGTQARASGKWYAEFFIDNNTGNDLFVGADSGSGSLSTYPGGSAGGEGYYSRSNFYQNGSSGSGFTAYTTGDVIGLAYNADAGKMWVSKNGVWSGDPVAETGQAFGSVPAGQYLAAGAWPSGASITLSTAPAQLVYAPPSGFSAWG